MFRARSLPWPILLTWGLAVIGASCRPRPEAAPGIVPVPPPISAPSAPSSPTPSISVVLPAGDAELEAAIRGGSFFRWVARSDSERAGRPVPRVTLGVSPDARADVRVEVARLPAPERFAALAADLPVRFDGDAFELGGSRYASPGQTLSLRLVRAERPTWLVAGRDAGALGQTLDGLLPALSGIARRRAAAPLGDYLVRETPWLSRSGRFVPAEAPGKGYRIDPAGERDTIAARDAEIARAEPIRVGSIVLLVPPAGHSGPAGPAALPRRGELAALAADLDRTARGLAIRIPYGGDLGVTLVVEPDHASQARDTGAVGAAVPGGRADLALVYAAEDRDAFRFALAQLFVERSGLARGWPPELAAGAALWLSRGWYGRDAAAWLPALARAGGFPSAAELTAVERAEDGSGPLATPVAAALIDRLPGADLAAKLAGGPPDRARVSKLLAEIAASALGSRPREDPAAGARRPLPRFFRGVSFAMLNSVDGGYHAPSVGRELDRLAGLGADAVSLMPFAYEPDPHAPELQLLASSPASETDAGLVHAARRAHERGFRVLWKPHVWVGRDSWPGDVEMSNAADWRAWLAAYRRYVLHQAFLAAWAKADLFAVGTELDRTFAREADWRDLIAAVRLVYPGPVTYAANWDRAEGVPVWDALDAVGVDAYFPLAPGESATDAELALGAREVARRLAALAARAGRPLLLTEVGFPARRAAWRAPSVEGGTYAETDQARAYAALFSALERPPWLAGLFVWKSFSDEAGAGGAEPDFRFLGRQAEGAIRAYYGGG